MLNEAESPFLALWVVVVPEILWGAVLRFQAVFNGSYKLMRVLLLVHLAWVGFAQEDVPAGLDPGNHQCLGDLQLFCCQGWLWCPGPCLKPGRLPVLSNAQGHLYSIYMLQRQENNSYYLGLKPNRPGFEANRGSPRFNPDCLPPKQCYCLARGHDLSGILSRSRVLSPCASLSVTGLNLTSLTTGTVVCLACKKTHRS